MDKCPHCGGVNGVDFKVTVEAVRHRHWNGEEEGLDNQRIIREGVLKCSDCGKRISPHQWGFESARSQSDAAGDA